MNHEIYNRLKQLPASFYKKYGIIELSIFGSNLRDDYTETSDIDLLVEYDPERKRSLFDKSLLLNELEEFLNKKVDLISKDAITKSRNFLRKKEILKNHLIIYAA